MKYKNITVAFIALIALAMAACNKENDEITVPEEEIVFEENELLEKSLTSDGDTLVKIVDKFVNFGSDDEVVLFPIHNETLIQKEGYERLWFPVHKEHLEEFAQGYAQEFGLPFITDEEKVILYKSILDFIHTNELDLGLILALREASSTKIATIVDVASCSNVQANDFLYDIFSGYKTEEEIRDEINVSQTTLKNGTGEFELEITLLVADVEGLAEEWGKFVLGDKADEDIDEINNSTANCLNGDDTDVNHYEKGANYISPSYNLNYHKKKENKRIAKIEYHIEGGYKAIHETIPGKYVVNSVTKITDHVCKGRKFVLSGKTNYSLPINTGTFDEPVAAMNGQVIITYGKGRNHRYTSYLNFKINAETGYKKVTFDDGQ